MYKYFVLILILFSCSNSEGIQQPDRTFHGVLGQPLGTLLKISGTTFRTDKITYFRVIAINDVTLEKAVEVQINGKRFSNWPDSVNATLTGYEKMPKVSTFVRTSGGESATEDDFLMAKGKPLRNFNTVKNQPSLSVFFVVDIVVPEYLKSK